MTSVPSTETNEDVARLRATLKPLPAPLGQPVLILMSGLPGTAKSYLSRRLAKEVPIAILETDALRPTLSARPKHTKSESARLFRAVHQLLDDLLRERLPVLLDATNLIERNRETLYKIADANGARLIILLTDAPIETVRERLRWRKNGSKDADDRSEADMRVYGRMRRVQERIGRRYITVDTSREVTPLIQSIAKQIAEGGQGENL